MVLDIALALIYFTMIGWAVHKIMGQDGGKAHYCFVGAAGSGLGAFIEWVTGRYTTTFSGAIGLCLVCACFVELIIRYIKHKLWVREVHKLGGLTRDDFDGDLHIILDSPDDSRQN